MKSHRIDPSQDRVKAEMETIDQLAKADDKQAALCAWFSSMQRQDFAADDQQRLLAYAVERLDDDEGEIVDDHVPGHTSEAMTNLADQMHTVEMLLADGDEEAKVRYWRARMLSHGHSEADMRRMLFEAGEVLRARVREKYGLDAPR